MFLSRDLPESFNVLVKELQSLAMNVELMESDILTETAATADQVRRNAATAVVN